MCEETLFNNSITFAIKNSWKWSPLKYNLDFLELMHKCEQLVQKLGVWVDSSVSWNALADFVFSMAQQDIYFHRAERLRMWYVFQSVLREEAACWACWDWQVASLVTPPMCYIPSISLCHLGVDSDLSAPLSQSQREIAERAVGQVILVYEGQL